MQISTASNGELPTLQGGFNMHERIEDRSEKQWLRREAHRNGRATLQKVCDEFASYGWVDRGNTVRQRSVEEQLALTTKAHALHLLVYGSAARDRGTMLIPYIEDTEGIDQYLQKATKADAIGAVTAIYNDVERAHQHGIIYGDRWSDNILVSRGPTPAITHIDFDLQYEGAEAREMEVARLTFYLLHAGKEKVRSTIATLLRTRDDLHIQLVEQIVRGHVQYFEGGRFGGSDQLVDDLWKEIRDSHSNKHHV